MISQLNHRALAVLQQSIEQADQLRIESHSGNRLIDFGVNTRGGLQAGLRLARICMSDMATIALTPDSEVTGGILVQVHTDQPGLACMGSQYGGWPVQGEKFFAIGSGPFRLARGKEKVLEQYGWSANQGPVVGVLESGKLPDEAVLKAMADECQVEMHELNVAVAPTKSLAGSLQVVARSVEATMHKLFELKVDLTKISSGFGTAPLPAVANNDLVAIGRTNDSILYSGRVTLWLDMNDEQINEIGIRVPSNSSPDFGKPFAELFEEAGGDFYKLDPMLFSAAVVTLISNESGNSFTFGETKQL